MADSPVTELHQHLADLAHKQVTVSYVLIGVLMLVLGLAGLGGYLGLKSYEAQVARAEAAEQRYDQDRKAFSDALAAHDAQRTVDAQKQADILAQIAKRAQTTDKAIQTALKPDATLPVIEVGLRTAYAGVPGFEGPLTLTDTSIGLSGPQAQQITAYKIDHDRLKLDLADTQGALGIEKNTSGSLLTDLNASKKNNLECEEVVAAYKKAAIKSKWRKMWDGAQKVLLVVAGVGLGRAIH